MGSIFILKMMPPLLYGIYCWRKKFEAAAASSLKQAMDDAIGGNIMDLKEKAGSSPKSPGVYFMKDALGIIIYVGKSKNLRQRLNQYFGVSVHRQPKVEKMIKNIQDFEYTVVDTELEAFLMECKLIKELKPRYNRQIKKYMGYPYIEITVNEPFPRIRIVQGIRLKSALYFGPYHSLNSVERSIEIIKEDSWLRLGKPDDMLQGWNPLKGQLGSDITPLIEEDEEGYRQYIEKVIGLLKGNDTSFLDNIKARMEEASFNFRFEEAAKYRDDIKVLSYIVNASKIVEEAKQRKGLVAFEAINENLGKVFLFSGSSLIYSELVSFKEDNMKAYIPFLKEKIADNFERDEKTYDEGFSKEDLDEIHIIYSYLKNKKGSIRYFSIDDSFPGGLEGEKVLSRELEQLFIS